MYQYLVVPFQGQAKGSLDAKAVAGVAHQLQDMINKTVADGWEFVEVSRVSIEVAPGCLGGLFGARSNFTTFEEVIFRKMA